MSNLDFIEAVVRLCQGDKPDAALPPLIKVEFCRHFFRVQARYFHSAGKPELIRGDLKGLAAEIVFLTEAAAINFRTMQALDYVHSLIHRELTRVA